MLGRIEADLAVCPDEGVDRGFGPRSRTDHAGLRVVAQGADAEVERVALVATQAEAAKQRAAAQEVITRRAMTNFIGQQLPPGATVELLADQSVFIKNSINEVKENGISGALIAIAVLYLFLRNVTQTLIVSLCIPISVLATFAPMYMADVSLNIISLGGLALGIGNLVDADLAKESAKLQSLQIKQQLGAQALSIANQAPQMILSLFRN